MTARHGHRGNGKFASRLTHCSSALTSTGFRADLEWWSMARDVDDFFDGLEAWGEECRRLRLIALATGLAEEWKWKQPCYTHAGKNVAMISPFKKYASLSFFQGVLLKDEATLLTTPGKDSQSARQWRFASVEEIAQHEATIAEYLSEAMGHVDAGTKVDFSAKDELVLPDELIERFQTVDGLEDAFMALTPGRQRGFILHIDGAKQSATRRARVDKHIERILAGKGIHDCICGKSARMPRCDGSHAR